MSLVVLHFLDESDTVGIHSKLITSFCFSTSRLASSDSSTLFLP